MSGRQVGDLFIVRLSAVQKVYQKVYQKCVP